MWIYTYIHIYRYIGIAIDVSMFKFCSKISDLAGQGMTVKISLEVR
jgi:hypothetical protein